MGLGPEFVMTLGAVTVQTFRVFGVEKRDGALLVGENDFLRRLFFLCRYRRQCSEDDGRE
jgi:hypothetical protein